MYRPRKLSLLLAIAMLLQLVLSGWVSTGQASAASGGPVVSVATPQNGMTNVPLGSNLRLFFDENVRKGESTAYIKIYRSSDNQLFEEYRVTDSQIRINSSDQREVIIDPIGTFESNTRYYVLIDNGAFRNVSNNNAYAGISSASAWYFTTIDTTSAGPNTAPVPVSYSPQGLNAAISPDLIIQFDQPVFASEGNITIRSNIDTRVIPVTSGNVTGSGTDTITIRLDGPLQPNTVYTVELTQNNFQNAYGNGNNAVTGSTWQFATASAPVNHISLSPANNTNNVAVNAPLTISFDRPVQTNANKKIEIRRVSDNSLLQAAITSSGVNVSSDGTSAIINHINFVPGTAYYVLIEPGFFSLAGDSAQWHYGISAATQWTFIAGTDVTPPKVTSFVPAHNGRAASVNTKLQLVFDEPVYQHSGTIVIYSSNGSEFRRIPITSERITGGGTNTLTIDANRAISGEAAKSFVNNTKYYVTISSNALRDASGNFYGGISGSSGWTFTITSDNTPPQLVSLSPANNATAVPHTTSTQFIATFNEAVMKSERATEDEAGKGIWFYPTGSGSSVRGDFRVDPSDSKRIIITPRSNLSQNMKYYINIEAGAITDLAGNAYIGILNQHQWTFTTIGGDRTPPVVSKTEVSGATVRIIYNEPLKETAVPSPANYYVTVAGAPRNVSSVKVQNNTVQLTLASTTGSTQKVEVSYTRPSNTNIAVQDLSGNLAANMNNVVASNGFTGTAPTITSASAYGTTVSLTFSETLSSVNAYAYSQFTVNVGGVNRTPTAISHSGSTIQLTLPVSITSGQSVKVSYSPGNYPLTGISGSRVNSISNYTVTGGSSNDNVAPYVQYVIAVDNIVMIKYNESLNAASTPSSHQYSITVDNNWRAISSVALSGDTVVITLSSAVQSNQVVKVSYTAVNGKTTDLAGNTAASFSNLVANSGTGTGGNTADLQGAILKGSTLTLTFNEALNSSYVPRTSQFIVRINNSQRNVTNVSVSGNNVVLTLSTPANVGEWADVSYMTSGTALRTANGTTLNGFTNVNVANQTTVLDSLTGDYESAVGGGVAIKSSGASQTWDQSPAGTSASRYQVMGDRVITAVNTQLSASMNQPRVVFKVPDNERAALVSVPLLTLETVIALNSNVTFAVQHGDVTYELPLKTLDMKKLATMSGGNVATNQLLIAIDKGASAKTSDLTNAISRAGTQIVAGPVHFEVLVLNGSARQTVNDYKGYVSRTIKTNAGITSSQMAAVWLDPVTGQLSYAPTTFKTENGVTTITFKRKGNSAYAIVRNTFSFSDLGSHWATSAVNSMARKFIVDGKTSTAFAPNQPITRGEFAAYIAKGLGLAGDREAAAKFKDVNVNTVMGAYIGAAAGNDIIAGTTPTTFSPNSYITRQDMAIIMLRAAKEAGMTISMPNSADSYLAPYKDKNKISAYAKNAMAQAVYAGFINGQSPTSLNPTGNATRAEATVMIMRLLQKADLLTS